MQLGGILNHESYNADGEHYLRGSVCRGAWAEPFFLRQPGESVSEQYDGTVGTISGGICSYSFLFAKMFIL